MFERLVKSINVKTQMLRCFLSPGAGTLAISRELRLVWQKFVGVKLANNKVSIVCTFKSQFHMQLRLDNDVTTRWLSILVARNWSGGRWRADSFLSQGALYEPPWLARSSFSLVALMTMVTT